MKGDEIYAVRAGIAIGFGLGMLFILIALGLTGVV